ncbi:5'-nucleotidase C-terminal domain-containing protein, partial [Parabacteroides distasonis]|nr:5'-nucleotidase C-terminal domain-containing protein [Parabacteroides distasonis]
ESPVGNLVTDAQVYMANKNGVPVDFAMTNNGGIRDDLKVKPDSSITWGAAQAVQPFGNIMQIVEMTGQQIENVLNQQDEKYFLQVS